MAEINLSIKRQVFLYVVLTVNQRGYYLQDGLYDNALKTNLGDNKWHNINELGDQGWELVTISFPNDDYERTATGFFKKSVWMMTEMT